MLASLHKILIHGSAIIDSLSFPIGQLTEEAQEARHKNYRSIRQHHSRKRSRIATNEDVMHTHLITSDRKKEKFFQRKSSIFGCIRAFIGLKICNMYL